MARIIVIVGHSRQATLCEALGEAYRRGAASGGHVVDLFVTSRMTFDPILRGAYEEAQPLERDLAEAHDALLAADHIVLIFPLWLGTLPAILKGFLERIFQPDLMAARSSGRFPKLLAGKSARIIMTMGMPGFIYRWYFGAHALRMLKRNILRFLGAGRIRSTIYGMVEQVSDDKRKAWLREVEELGRRVL